MRGIESTDLDGIEWWKWIFWITLINLLVIYSLTQSFGTKVSSYYFYLLMMFPSPKSICDCESLKD